MNKNDKCNENSIVNGKIDFENTEIGQTYIMQLKTGALISGVLISKYEFLNINDGRTVRAYTIAFNNSKVIDIEADEIDRLDLVEHYNEKHKSVLEYLEDFQKKHNIKCFNDEGERCSNSTILGEVLVGKKLWDELLEEEKEEFIEKIRLTIDDMVEVINVCMKTLTENDRLHEDRLRMLDEANKLMDRYKKSEKLYSNIKKIYEIFFHDLKIEDLIKAI